MKRYPVTDGRCADCRRGHYAMPDGSISNPCQTEGCTCWFCCFDH